MPEPFKNQFNKNIINGMGDHFLKAWPKFDRDGFVKMAGKNLKALELKERSVQITDAMRAFLPDNYKKAAKIILKSLAPEDHGDIGNAVVNKRGITGWAIMPMTHYVGLYGLGHFEISMTLFKEMTKHFSSEFGIRFFLIAEQKRTLSILKTWTRDPSRHVRRLISEGTRPRLPWAMKLPAFIDNPTPVIALLKSLKDDKEEYVRRSVANNLNDIAKDHPAVVAQIAGLWLKGASGEMKKLVRHACRTLIKQGHQGTLKALGYGAPCIKLDKLDISTPRVIFGKTLEFDLSLTSTANRAQPLIIDYAIHHRKANGGTSAKVFKWKTTKIGPRATLTGNRKHAIRKITTRTYYPGTHTLELLINGVSFASVDFELVI